MYLHVGWGQLIRTKDIVAICSRETWNDSLDNQQMFRMFEIENKVEKVDSAGKGEPDYRSIVVCADKLVLSPITPNTLHGRLQESF